MTLAMSTAAEPAPKAPPVAPLRTPWLELGVIALVAALDALVRLGRIHPDEVYQVLEPALSRAFGFGVVAWEWQVGLRNWAVPGLFAAILKALSAVGVDDPFARRVALEVPQLALHLAMLGAVYRLAVRRVDPLAARLSALLVGVYPPLVWFGGRTMSESFSTALLVWGLERLDADDRRALTPLLGGALLGCAEVTRYGSAAVIVPAMLWLLVTRRWRAFALAAAGGLVVALGLGLLDRLTWGALPTAKLGGWWHSLALYAEFNVLSGQAAAQFGASPWHEYLTSLFVAPWAVLGLLLPLRPNAGAPGSAQRAGRPWLFVVSALGYLAAISATPHKEPRFVYPALVLLAVAGAPGFASFTVRSLRGVLAATPPSWLTALLGDASTPLPSRLVASLRLGLATLAIAGACAFYFVKTPFDVERPEQFQLTLRAGREATGFLLMNEGVWGSGGYFYLGRNIPWFPALGPCDVPQSPCFQIAARDPVLNRAIYWDDPSAPARNASTVAAFQAIGFRELEHRGPAHYFARP